MSEGMDTLRDAVSTARFFGRHPAEYAARLDFDTEKVVAVTAVRISVEAKREMSPVELATISYIKTDGAKIAKSVMLETIREAELNLIEAAERVARERAMYAEEWWRE